mmetsp:Transcript_9161/g.20212  ORF Transcript_9161/g.20212 Transcript_9161/m.20212 type:complete len:389 (-) Transcript_9161:88-1254(-)
MFVSAFRLAVRRPIRLVTSADQCQNVVERILSSGVRQIGVDCEGEELGRFGRLSLLQLATDKEVFLLDLVAAGPSIMEPMKPLLADRDVVKVFHDCREDAALLLHQHNAPMAAVFDTQVGHAAWLERKNLEPFQANVGELLRTFLLKSYIAHRWDELERHPIQPLRWKQRPLDRQAVRYAVEGVAHLTALRDVICRELGDPEGDLVLRRSVSYLKYADMNMAELPSAEAAAALRKGSALQAMLASRRPDAAYFKLNHGTLTGAVLDATDLQDFADVKPGDVVQCRVSSVSECRRFVHLKREGHGNLFYDRIRQEMRVLPSTADGDHSSRQSSLYGLAKWRPGSNPPIQEEPASYRERKPEVIYKLGKRGAVKVRKTSTRPPPRRREED